MSDLIGYPADILNARATVTWTRLAGGSLQVYTGPRPETNGAAITTQTLLAEFAWPDPAGEIEGWVFTGAQPGSALILASDNAAWVRAVDDSGNPIADMDAGLTGSGAAAQFDNLALVAGGMLYLTQLVVSEQ